MIDADRFAAFTRSLTSRRRVMQALAGLVAGVSVGGSVVLTEARGRAAARGPDRARHRHHHHKRRCLDIGATCVQTTPTKPTRCCSGQCGCVGTDCTCRNATCGAACDTIADCCQGQCAAGISMCF